MVKLVKIIEKHNIKLWIDPHQDVWSRFTGGSGHPAWTLYLAGFNPKNFEQTAAAVTHFQYSKNPLDMPKMVWSTNYEKLASATMFSLFYGGELFAPKCTVKLGDKLVNIQEYLQTHYINAYTHLAKRFAKERLLGNTVIGFETMNEPNYGYLGYDKNLDDYRTNGMSMARMGDSPKCFEALKLGMGIETEVGFWGFGWLGLKELSKKKINPQGVRAWLQEGEIPSNVKLEDWQPWQTSGKCIWAEHGVWDVESKKLLQPQYFKNNPKTNKPMDVINECWKPFCIRYTNAIRTVKSDLIMLWSPTVFDVPPEFSPEEESVTKQLVYSPHWYDGLTLSTLTFNWYNADTLGVYRHKYWNIVGAVRIGLGNIRNLFTDTIKLLHDEAQENFKGVPVIIGETGIPYNMDNNKAFKTGDYSSQILAMDNIMNACEQPNVMSCTWNYSPLNSHDLGDFWNLEDLSIYCNEEDTPSSYSAKSDTLWLNSIDRGGRALESTIRPYALEIPGTVTKNYFQPRALNKKGPVYEFSYKVDLSVKTEYLVCKVFVPVHHYPPSSVISIEVNKGSFEVKQVELPNPSQDNPSESLYKRYLIWELNRNDVKEGEEVKLKLQIDNTHSML